MTTVQGPDGVTIKCDGFDPDTFEKCDTETFVVKGQEIAARARLNWRHDAWYNKDYCHKHQFEGKL